MLDHIHKIPLDEGSTIDLQTEWLTSDEREERDRTQARQRVLRQSTNPTIESHPTILPIDNGTVTNTVPMNPSLQPTSSARLQPASGSLSASHPAQLLPGPPVVE